MYKYVPSVCSAPSSSSSSNNNNNNKLNILFLEEKQQQQNAVKNILQKNNFKSKKSLYVYGNF